MKTTANTARIVLRDVWKNNRASLISSLCSMYTKSTPAMTLIHNNTNNNNKSCLSIRIIQTFFQLRIRYDYFYFLHATFWTLNYANISRCHEYLGSQRRGRIFTKIVKYDLKYVWVWLWIIRMGEMGFVSSTGTKRKTMMVCV